MITVREGQIIARKFRLTRLLAKGGMGSVWAAVHVTLDVPVAVKFMDPRYADMNDLRGRFKREARATAQLRSPNVVQILDYGVEEETPYLAMEFLTGEDLGVRLAREGRLALHDALPIFIQIGKALHRAHDAGVVHRDLKPANVFLDTQHDEILVKVVDFGIAKLMRQDILDDATKTGTLLGSPHYMSPEQIRGSKAVDHRTDLWSLGVIIYRSLTGELPFPGVQMGDLFLRICTERALDPTRHVPSLGTAVDSFIFKALSADVSERFQSAKDMIEALKQLTHAAPNHSVTRIDPLPTSATSEPDGDTHEQITTPLKAEPQLPKNTTEPLISVAPANTSSTQPISREELIEGGAIDVALTRRKNWVGMALGLAASAALISAGFYATQRSEARTEPTTIDTSAPSSSMPHTPSVMRESSTPRDTRTEPLGIKVEPSPSTVLPSTSTLSPDKPIDKKRVPVKIPTAPAGANSTWGI